VASHTLLGEERFDGEREELFAIAGFVGGSRERGEKTEGKTEE